MNRINFTVYIFFTLVHKTSVIVAIYSMYNIFTIFIKTLIHLLFRKVFKSRENKNFEFTLTF